VPFVNDMSDGLEAPIRSAGGYAPSHLSFSHLSVIAHEADTIVLVQGPSQLTVSGAPCGDLPMKWFLQVLLRPLVSLPPRGTKPAKAADHAAFFVLSCSSFACYAYLDMLDPESDSSGNMGHCDPDAQMVEVS
jgi:hypothetical protein